MFDRVRQTLFSGWLTSKNDYFLTREYIAGYILTLTHHILCVVAGVIGFVVEPSVTIARTGGVYVAWLWSAIFIIFGLCAIIARFAKRINAEAIAVIVIVLGRLLWSVIIIAEVAAGRTPLGSLQIAVLIASTGFFLMGWSLTVFIWVAGTPMELRATQATTALRKQLIAVVKKQVHEDS